jgi:hypothetical protein
LDGKVWQDRGRTTADRINSLAFGNGVFVALFNDTPYWSVDGLAWTLRSGDASRMETLIFGNGVFFGYTPAWSQGLSRDGKNWKDLTQTNNLLTATYANGRFFAATFPRYTRSEIVSSASGERWEKMSTGPIDIETGVLHTMLAGNGRLAVLRYRNANYYVSASPTFTTLSVDGAPSGASVQVFGETGSSHWLEFTSVTAPFAWGNPIEITIGEKGFNSLPLNQEVGVKLFRVRTD